MPTLLQSIMAGTTLFVLSPLLLVIGAAVKLTSPGPVLHRCWRVGKRGRVFVLFKFRTMVEGADKMGPSVTALDDARVTPVGRFLRRTKMDELPQLLNVLTGTMDIVGPRPEDPKYVKHYSRDHLRLLDAKPGLTSLASVCFIEEERLLTGADYERTYIEQVLPAKLAVELSALRERSLAHDVTVILATIAKLVRLQALGRRLSCPVAVSVEPVVSSGAGGLHDTQPLQGT